LVTDDGAETLAEPEITDQLMVTPLAASEASSLPAPVRLGPGLAPPAITVSGSGNGVFTGVDWPSPLPLARLGAPDAVTLLVAVALLLPGAGSAVFDDTVAVFVIVEPSATVGNTSTASRKSVDWRGPMLDLEQVMVPPAPTAGVLHVHGNGTASEAKVTCAGNVSVMVTDLACCGPELATVIRYFNRVPADTGSGCPDLLIDRSAPLGAAGSTVMVNT